MTFVVLGVLGMALTVLIPVAVVQRRARLAPALRERQLAFAELAMDEIPDPPRARANSSRPAGAERTPAQPVTIGRIAVGVWLGLWLFVASAAVIGGIAVVVLWRLAGGHW